MTREQILQAVRDQYADRSWSTRDLAQLCDCAEISARAVVGWLLLGRQIERAGMTTRRDAGGRVYKVRLYRWTGATEITRVARGEMTRSALKSESARDLGADWLRRRLV